MLYNNKFFYFLLSTWLPSFTNKRQRKWATTQGPPYDTTATSQLSLDTLVDAVDYCLLYLI